MDAVRPLQIEVDDVDLIDRDKPSTSTTSTSSTSSSKSKDYNKKNKNKDKKKRSRDDENEEERPYQVGNGWKSLEISLANATSAADRSKERRTTDGGTQLPVVMGGAFYEKKQEYFNKFQSLLVKEAKAEKSNIERRLLRSSIHALCNSGLAVAGMTALVSGRLYGELIIRFVANDLVDLKWDVGDDEDIGSLKLKVGEPVIISRVDPLKDDDVFEGMLLELSSKALKVSLKCDDKADQMAKMFTNTKPWRVDHGTNCITIQRMMDGLHAIQSSQLLYKTKLYDIITGHLRGGTTLEAACAKEVDIYKLPTQRAKGEMLPHDFKEWKLNETQRTVIKSCVKRRVSLVQGPPGTGKTTTAVSLVRLLIYLKYQCQSSSKILVTAYTNAGVDNLLERLLACGVKVLRLGQSSSVRADLQSATLDYRLQEEMLQYKSRQDQAGIERDVKSRLIAEVDVICTTCISAGHPMLDDETFPIVVVDEATQAMEPAILVPLLKGSQQLFLFGDQNQLAPTVCSNEAHLGGLSQGLFQRLVKEGIKPYLLDIQYRMHSRIAEFPSLCFYENKLRNGIDDDDRPIPKGIGWPVQDWPVAFVHINGKEKIQNYSYSNKKEANKVVELLKCLVAGNKDLRINDIGIITPYSSQSRLIVDKLKAEKQFAKQLPTVATVDSFQGREKEIIILSTVRSNEGHRIGFLDDWRRLNVSLTRSKRGLLVVGNIHHLAKCPCEQWCKFAKWCIDNKLVVDED
ncbi:hypothetical protein SAMD00019534_097480 [Acytostelium subglobosum LB1]|uniref:hypothetical protein n=1 Tax=Acytostelium subglobosum LB1 TaxID=1410327 RepID=UPI0006448134|nr:hypothetical protein SAMD00019534_097480 [Acytostelium subglobosum LB1]GAM26573.1 hypothetical protein SAMD00019534_097480 [Acytostelium subglobosum LB1]|eukprot:XP_012750669.1 hypothetical protein SAMD00019534_097480 [Acytostelium subglobosum LB1]